MFMLFKADAYRNLGGFDERYYMYYEDVDICTRAWSTGLSVLACNTIKVVHDAQRASHQNPQHLIWHLRSMARYLVTGKARQARN
jgi:N-acetylglucosaminyl-diphospho-decaprenol L-rhamnosyltransferase